jgi:hypothetical protein
VRQAKPHGHGHGHGAADLATATATATPPETPDIATSPAPPPRSTSTSPADHPPATGIFGSVTTADVANSIRSLLAASEDEASRVAVEPRAIRFLDPDAEGGEDRVKSTGLFEVEIALSAEVSLRKTVEVVAAEDAKGEDGKSEET